jgi:hypothetical protein
MVLGTNRLGCPGVGITTNGPYRRSRIRYHYQGAKGRGPLIAIALCLCSLTTSASS